MNKYKYKDGLAEVSTSMKVKWIINVSKLSSLQKVESAVE